MRKGKQFVYQVRGQLNGMYMPDYMALHDTWKSAVVDARSMAEEYADAIEDEDTITSVDRDDYPGEPPIAYFYVVRTRESGSDCPYFYAAEARPWRDVAQELGVRTRTEVLEQDLNI